MRTFFLTLTLLLSAISSSAFAEESFITSPSLKAKMVSANQQPPTYQMLCRGPFLFLEGDRYGPKGEEIVTLEFVFTPSRQAAGPRGLGLEPGQCSWIDRPVNENEPHLISFETPLHFKRGPTDRSPTAAETSPDVDTIVNYMRDENHYWSFFVYNTTKRYTKERYLQSTTHKYFKKISPRDEIRRVDPKRPKDRDRVLIPGKP
jgi:hypothetical protein